MKQKILSVSLGLILLVSVVSMFFYSRYETANLRNVKNDWQHYQANIKKEAHLLSILSNEIGYGGFIHNFKNFVLRKDPSYFELARVNVQKIKNTLDEYGQLPLSQMQKTALKDIKAIFNAYSEKLKIAQQVVSDSKAPSSETLDELVRVDDGPAVRALTDLRSELERHYSDLSQHMSVELHNASSTLSVYLPSAMAIFVILGVLLAWAFSYHSIRESQVKETLTVNAKKYEKTLTVYYAAAVSILALIIIFGYSYINFQISRVENDAQTINVAGQQRMLSQRITLAINHIADHWDSPETHDYAVTLGKLIKKMQNNHKNLTLGNPKLNMKPATEDNIRAFYFNKPANLDERVASFLQQAGVFLSSYKTAIQANREDILKNLSQKLPDANTSKANLDTLLKALDDVVLTYQRNSENDVKTFSRLETILVAFALFVLLMEVLFIFRPMVKRASSQLSSAEVARQRAIEMKAIKSEFLESMSHEIRAPMGGILGMAELIQDSTRSPQIAGYANAIIRSSESLQQIIEDIFDFSQIEAKKVKLQMVAVDMADLIDEVVEQYNQRALDKNIELAVHYKSGAEQFVFADPKRMAQIIGNLLGNAIKFTQEGNVTITVEQLDGKNAADKSATLKFSVIDTGIGISPAEKENVFQKYSHGDHTQQRKHGGTGLGLSISKSLVELMGGHIGVESADGKGSMFWFSVTFEKHVKPKVSKTQYEMLRGIRALVVDDLHAVRAFVCEKLNEIDMFCEVASSCEQALSMMTEAYFSKRPYHIAIVDHTLKNINNENLIDLIENNDKLQGICLITMQSANHFKTSTEIFAESVSGSIQKPISKRNLMHGLLQTWNDYTNAVNRKEAGTISKDTLQVKSNNGGIDDDIDFQNSPKPIQNDPRLEGLEILLADDDGINQLFIKETLELMGANCTAVSDGQKAIESIRKNNYDLVFMDCLMPGIDGWEATKAIRNLEKKYGSKPVKICALTAHTMEDDRKKCFESGMDDYLSKPVRKEKLKAKLYELLFNESYKDSLEHLSALPKAKNQELLQSIDHDIKAFQNHKNQNNASLYKQIVNQKADESQNDVSDHLFKNKDDLTQAPENKDSIGCTYDNVVLDDESVIYVQNVLKDKFDMMVDMYIHNSKKYIEDIKEAVELNDMQALVRPAHTLKSTSKQLGALKLASVADDLEYMAVMIHKNSGNTHDYQKKIQEITLTLDSLLFKTELAFEKVVDGQNKDASSKTAS